MDWPELLGGLIGIGISAFAMFCFCAWFMFLPVVGFLYMIGYLV